MEATHRLNRLRTYLVFDADRADHLAITDDAHHGATAVGPAGSHRLERDRRLDAELTEEARSADVRGAVANSGARTAARQVLKPSRGCRGDTTPARSLDDGSRQRVLAVCLDCRGHRHQLLLIDAWSRRHSRQHWLATGQRAGLVEDDGVEVLGPLECQPILDQQAIACAKRRADGDDQRNCQAKSVRAGDDQHGRSPDQPFLRISEQRPGTEGQHASHQGHVEQDCRSTVGQGLRPAVGGLCLGDQAHDPRQRRLVADCCDAHPEASPCGDGPGHDLVSGLLGHRARLAGDH